MSAEDCLEQTRGISSASAGTVSAWLFASARRPNRARLWRVDIRRDGPTLGNQAERRPVREFNHVADRPAPEIDSVDAF